MNSPKVDEEFSRPISCIGRPSATIQLRGTAAQPRQATGWSRPDLARRVVYALDVAVRATRALTIDEDPFVGDLETLHTGQRLIGPKVVAEAAMLLLCAASVQDADDRIRDGVDLLTNLLLRHARSDSVLAAVCLDPGRAPDHAIAHLILSHLGHTDHDVDRLVALSLASGRVMGPERLAHRELEQEWLERLWPVKDTWLEPDSSLLARSSLGRQMDALGSTPFDRYAFTHAILYASDLGQRSIILPRPPTEICADADAALAASLDANNLDLTVELLWTWPMLGIAWSPTAAFATKVLATVENETGFLPGPGFSPAAYQCLPADERSHYALTTSYHTALVMGFLCAAVLRSGNAPREAPPGCSSPGAATAVLRLIDADEPGHPWIQVYRDLPTRQQDALAALPLGVALRRGRALSDLGRVRAALEVAVAHDLLYGPAPAQAAALLRRGAALTATGRTRAQLVE